MSTARLVQFQGGLAHLDREYPNSFGIGPMIWRALVTRYREVLFPFDRDQLRIRNPFDEYMALFEGYAELPLRPWELVALRFTFERAVTMRPELESLARALERFEEAHVRPRESCHLREVALRIDELRAWGNVEAVGLWVTSVDANPWATEEGEPRPLTWRKANVFSGVNWRVVSQAGAIGVKTVDLVPGLERALALAAECMDEFGRPPQFHEDSLQRAGANRVAEGLKKLLEEARS